MTWEANHFRCHSFDQFAWGDGVARTLAAALEAVEPGAAVRRALGAAGILSDVTQPLADFQYFTRIFLVSVGKASVPMAMAAADTLAGRLTGGVVITKLGHTVGWQPNRNLELIEAGHPIPNHQSLYAAKRIQDLLSATRTDDLVITLISGGGSALMVAPVPGVTLADLQELTTLLLTCGANIQEMNTLRKHLDQIKGGGLARLAYPATLITLILSDVVGDALDVIASGPTVPDPTTYKNAWQVLEDYRLTDRIPQSIYSYLQAGISHKQPETPKPGDPCFEHSLQRWSSPQIIGNNYHATQAAIEQAKNEGYHTLLLTNYLQGEARSAGCFIAAIARQIAYLGTPLSRPACLIAGGETTVSIKGCGLGGRNQELAFGAVVGLAGLCEVLLVSLATDGGDGPTDAAGAVVTGETLLRCQQRGLNPSSYLANNNAYPFFAALDDLLITGPTQTNVNDLVLLFLH